jgi:hypothetical protein
MNGALAKWIIGMFVKDEPCDMQTLGVSSGYCLSATSARDVFEAAQNATTR